MVWSIKKKILLLSIGLSIFAVTIIFSLYSYKTSSVLNENKRQNLIIQGSLIQSTIDRFLHERLSDVLDLAQDSLFMKQEISGINNKIIQYTSSHSYFESISYFDTKRTRLADSKNLEIGKQHSLITYWKKLVDSHYVVDISVSESMKINVIHFACKIYTNGRHTGYLVARMDARKVNEIFNYVLNKQSSFANKVNIELIDSSGIILFSNNKTNFYNLLESKINKDIIGNTFINYEDYYINVQKLNGYKNYPGNNWLLLLSTNKKNLLNENRSFTVFLISVSIVVLIIVCIIALLFSKILVKPIDTLSAAAKAYGNGNLRHRFQIETKDELQHLGEHIKIMAGKLKEKIEAMENLNEEMKQNLNTVYDQKQFILTQNQRINNGLNIAHTFQKSLLPKMEEVFYNSKIKCEIFNKPRLKVCSDFYFMKNIRTKEADYKIVAIIGCSKQGLAGAFITIIANNLLTQIVDIEQEYDPCKIISEMDKKLYSMFSNSFKNNFGVSLGVVQINEKKQELIYCGAKQDLMISDNKNVKEIKGYESYLGLSEYKNLKECAKNIHPFKENSMIVLANKGIEDQKGGIKEKRFSSQKVKEAVESYKQISAKKFILNLKTEIENWSNESEQEDDYLAIALKMSTIKEPMMV